MKSYALVAALAASVALASPAEAASKKRKKGVHRAPISTVHAKPHRADPYEVYSAGEYIGRDPDPFIRSMMYRNPYIWDGPD